MIVDKLLTQRGWRVVAHCMLAASGVAFLYLLSRMVTESIHHGYQLNPWILGIAIVLSLWSVALGGMLARSELTDWRG
jgi:Na+/alanine symporter